MHLTTSPVDWYAARAAGVVAYVLLTVVVSLGLALAGRQRLPRWPRFALEDVHRFGGLLVGSFVALHVVTIAIDAYLPFSVGALVVPLASRYRPLWVALGIVGAELLLALAVTNRLRGLIPYRVWRRAHYLNFAVWGAATLHALGAGTDRSATWLVALAAGAVGLVLGLVVYRLLRRTTFVPLVGAFGAAAVVWLAVGPLAYHARTWNARSFHDRLSGQLVQAVGATRGLISLVGTATGEQRALVRADLLVEPRRLDATAFQMEFLPSGLRCKGRVTRVAAYGFTGTCRAGDGTTRVVKAAWSPGEGSSFTGGTLDAHA